AGAVAAPPGSRSVSTPGDMNSVLLIRSQPFEVRVPRTSTPAARPPTIEYEVEGPERTFAGTVTQRVTSVEETGSVSPPAGPWEVRMVPLTYRPLPRFSQPLVQVPRTSVPCRIVVTTE